MGHRVPPFPVCHTEFDGLASALVRHVRSTWFVDSLVRGSWYIGRKLSFTFSCFLADYKSCSCKSRSTLLSLNRIWPNPFETTTPRSFLVAT